MWTLIFMGSSLYWYVVPYESDVNSALQKLREREFHAGRYNPVVEFPHFPVESTSESPGTLHESIEEALDASGADGTRSILDIMGGVSPDPGFSSDPDMMAHPLTDAQLVEFFGTTTPEAATIVGNYKFLDKISRGSGVYIIMKESGQPREIFFAGYSFD
jgi:hypothetical protein